MRSEIGSRQWKLKSKGEGLEESPELIQALQDETGLSSLVLRVCVQRGLDNAQAIQSYLSPRFENLTSPFLIKNMDVAVERITRARDQGEKVRIFGDYDVDGTTGSALLFRVFREMGIPADVRQPDRFRDGYGLNEQAVDEAVQAGVQVLITVDCGISSFDAAEKAKRMGLSLIIVDHHQIDPKRGLPPAEAVVNPQQEDCTSGLRQLCGCGLAFYLAIALRSQGRRLGWFASGNEPNMKQHLDLVVIATAADMVPLTGDNHILVKYGLEVLKTSKKPGVKALLEAAGLGLKDVSPSHLGFVLGPRINASGRMVSANLALELLTTEDTARACELAQELEALNQERANLQNQIWDEVRARIEEGIKNGKYRHAIAVADAGWHEGVVGIVASRVTETFQKPAAVIALREDFGKGSVRSFGGKDVLSALQKCSSYLKGFGGHKYAAGLSVELGQFEAFSEAFDLIMEKIPQEKNSSVLLIEGACSIYDLNVRMLQELERLGPFGPGNPEPVFALKASVKGHRILKGRHLKLNLAAPSPDQATLARPMQSGSSLVPEFGIGERSSEIDAIWFHAAERDDTGIEDLFSEEREWAGVPELNRFRGQMTPTFRVKDWRKLGNEAEIL